MIQVNQKKIGDKKIKNKVGRDANESRFGYIERELREKKLIVVPSVNTNGILKIEQAWNKQATKSGILRITVKSRKKHIIVTREELEQALATMAQGAEVIKYQPPTIG